MIRYEVVPFVGKKNHTRDRERRRRRRRRRREREKEKERGKSRLKRENGSQKSKDGSDQIRLSCGLPDFGGIFLVVMVSRLGPSVHGSALVINQSTLTVLARPRR